MFSLRTKIIIALFAISALLSVALTVSTYTILERSLFVELQSRVRDLTNVGSLLINRTAIAKLAGEVKPGLANDAALAIERSPEYKVVSDELNRIRQTDKHLIRYVYSFVPTPDPNHALYVVDADVLSLLADRDAGKQVSDDDISAFGSDFDISQFPVARSVLRDKTPAVESAYSYDATFKVNSLSGYAPIFDRDGKTMLAAVGLDMTDTDVRAELQKATRLSLAAGVLALIVTLATSLLFGSLFTRGIVDLDRVVRRFGDKDLEVRAPVRSRDEIGRLGISFNQMADIIQAYSSRQEALLNAYGRFVPRDFLHILEKESIVDVSLGDQIQREMTVFFSDIQSFTELSESMTPRENFNFINSYLSRVGPEIRSHGGFIDKYIGDAIMALFPDRPDDAVRAAIATQKRVREYNGHRANSNYRPISVGIGIHTGKLMLGTVGEQERMDGSVISDAVNLCSRLESLTRIYGGTVLMTGISFSTLEGRTEFHTRFIDRVRVRGRKEAVLIYEVFDGDPEDQFDLKMSSRSDWNAAVKLYYDRQFSETSDLLAALREKNPADSIFEIYMKRCRRLIDQGVPEGWQGVEVIDLR